MNGRTYDPKLGRFMQADLFVQDPSDTQSYNRYSYVRNNPLNATDPSGFLFRELVLVVRDVAYIAFGDGWSDPNAWINLAGDLYALSGEFGSGGGGSGPPGTTAGAFGNRGCWNLVQQSGGGPQTAGTSTAGTGPIIDNSGASIDRRLLVMLDIQQKTTGETDSAASGGKFANGGASQSFDLSLARHPYIEEEEEDEENFTAAHAWLNGSSMALDATGIGAVVSWIPDVMDAGLSAYEGDWVGVGISTASVIPGIGNAGNMAKMARLGAKQRALQRTVVMGRNMGGRVIPYASKHGYDFYRGTPRWVPLRIEKVDLWLNKRWIRGEMKQGSRIVDIGEPPGMPPSIFYNMERAETSAYWNYVVDLQP